MTHGYECVWTGEHTEIKMVSFSVILIYSWPVKTEMVDLFILEKMLIEKILQFD